MCEVADRLIKKGEARGVEIGEAKGESLLATLINKLLPNGMISEIAKVTSDKS